MNTRYNSRHPMTKFHRHWTAALLAVVLASCGLAVAADWNPPASQLAKDIVAITGPGAASISYRNQSSLPNDQVDIVRRAIENQLRAGGLRLGQAATAAAEIRVTLSENTRGYVWVAEVQQGSEMRVAMVAAVRPAMASAPASPATISVRKTLLWSQPAQILDVAMMPAGSEPLMLVLDANGVWLYRKQGSTWEVQQSMGITREQAWPRDLRGRLVLARDHIFDAYLPGTVCTSSAGSPLTMTCRQGDDPWPVAPRHAAFYAPARNFFTGVLTPALGKQGSVAPFYSAAQLPRPKYTLWIFARTDSTVHAFDGLNDVPLRALGNLGSDLATVNSGCGSGTQLLVTGGGDGLAGDVIRVFELADRDALEAAPAVDFTGPITALWSAPDGRTALAVVHNLRSERYDAFEIAINCAQ